MPKDLAALIIRIIFGILLLYVGVRAFGRGIGGEPLVSNNDEFAHAAKGGERLQDGSTARSGEMIKPAGYNLNGLGDIVFGLGFFVGGIYRVYTAVIPLLPNKKPTGLPHPN